MPWAFMVGLQVKVLKIDLKMDKFEPRVLFTLAPPVKKQTGGW